MSPFRALGPWLVEPLERLEAAAANGRLGHGWLISGPRGVGKTNLAYIFVDRFLAGRSGQSAPMPSRARELLADYSRHAEGFDLHPDLHRVFANDERFKKDKDKTKRTISVDQIRAMTADLALKPHVAGRKLVVIEQAEAMTIEAANALLKTLEEPTPDTYLLLLADRPGRLPATIRSRCQQLPLARPPIVETEAWLEADGLSLASLPPQARPKPPLLLARLLEDVSLCRNYISLSSDIEVLLDGSGDPYALAVGWQRDGLEFALDCLVENLQLRIRSRLGRGHSNPVTDFNDELSENVATRVPTDALFAGLRMAENLREQLGRGTNVELALKALLLELDAPVEYGVNV